MSDFGIFKEYVAIERQISYLMPEAMKQVHGWNIGDIESVKEIVPIPGSEIVTTTKALSTIASQLGETLFACFDGTPLIVPAEVAVEDILIDYDKNRSL